MNGLFVSIGAGPGIGGSTASRFAREGFDLVLAARDASRLEPSAQKIRKETGQHVETVTLDATDFSAVQQFSERFGPAARILHYNAAAIQKMDVLETPVETTQRNLSVDILGALAAIKYFAPFMEKRRKVPPPDIARWGTYGEVANVPARHLVKHPENISFEGSCSLLDAVCDRLGSFDGTGKAHAG